MYWKIAVGVWAVLVKLLLEGGGGVGVMERLLRQQFRNKVVIVLLLGRGGGTWEAIHEIRSEAWQAAM